MFVKIVIRCLINKIQSIIIRFLIFREITHVPSKSLMARKSIKLLEQLKLLVNLRMSVTFNNLTITIKKKVEVHLYPNLLIIKRKMVRLFLIELHKIRVFLIFLKVKVNLQKKIIQTYFWTFWMKMIKNNILLASISVNLSEGFYNLQIPSKIC